MNKHDKTNDRPLLRKLVDIMKVSRTKIKLDECEDWCITTREGKVYTDGKKIYVHFFHGWKTSWDTVKTHLPFMEVQIDGDTEGVLALDRLPTKDEAEAIRIELKLSMKKVLTKEQSDILIRRFQKAQK